MPFLFYCFFTAAAPPLIYTLSLHDALPILPASLPAARGSAAPAEQPGCAQAAPGRSFTDRSLLQILPGPSDRKSTRLNSSHTVISYAVFCLKKKIYTDTSKQPAVLHTCIIH